MTGPAGGNSQGASATLTVTGASSSSGSGTSSGGGGGGGSFDWLDILLIAGIFLIIRGHASRRTRR